MAIILIKSKYNPSDCNTHTHSIRCNDETINRMFWRGGGGEVGGPWGIYDNHINDDDVVVFVATSISLFV